MRWLKNSLIQSYVLLGFDKKGDSPDAAAPQPMLGAGLPAPEGSPPGARPEVSRSRRRARRRGPTEADSHKSSIVTRLWRLFWLLVLVGHAMLAVLWWWLEPAGFGFEHPRFWVNRIAPSGGLCLTIAALWALRINSAPALRWLLPLWPSAWAAAALAGKLFFPVSLARVWLLPLGVAAAMALAVVPPWRGARGWSWVLALFLCLCSGVAGAALVGAQRPPPSATRPLNTDLADLTSTTARTEASPSGGIFLDPKVMVQGSDGSINVRVGTLAISVQPLLKFLNGSVDGCWTIFADPEDRAGPEPRLLSSRRDGKRGWAALYDFRRQGPATLRVEAAAQPGTIAIEATSRLDRLIYSHLKSFCDFEVRGHRRLSLEFSPCPGFAIEVRPFDYPFGRPARFAFLDARKMFRIVEATSGEKGPFRTLAEGPLGSAEELTMTLCDEGRALARVVLADWSAQADTTLSPTAGWGVPVNAIEFSLAGDAPSSPASIFVTLAATSVGRGWDCVGHRPGTYRNRIRLEPATALVGRGSPGTRRVAALSATEGLVPSQLVGRGFHDPALGATEGLHPSECGERDGQ